jgi:hypothetical protein
MNSRRFSIAPHVPDRFEDRSYMLSKNADRGQGAHDLLLGMPGSWNVWMWHAAA